MSDEKSDESLGLEHLPQSELEASPGGGEQSEETTTSDTNTNKGEVNKNQANDRFITQDNKDELPL